ncbi:hypothetical protein OJF2_26470 [Aquisphaera giovannonii]|uniref:Uncharacterized protein n=1 Tax=Aquisphaera giovannonii TaxID=406548 RepID=A0A5B9W0P3_9BACT|nr:hypothetical protein [Aquisphaera giovannonii]QEH34113.1 hypothetical protein OJF2_26470 [Aquisphaera giovannonii]
MTRTSHAHSPRVPTLGMFLVAGLCLAPTVRGAEDRPPLPVEVYEWSVWVGSPAQNSLNQPRVYRNAMPGPVGTVRPKVEGPELNRQFPVAPVSVVQAFGEPTQDVDFDLRVKKGSVLAHWPQATERSDGLRWFKANLLAAAPAGTAPGFIPEDHWFQKLRRSDKALTIKHETRVERFLSYDAEVAIPIPVKIRGGPDEYTLQNLTNAKLLDVAVIAPVDGGRYRFGWLDELPSGVPRSVADEEAAKEKEKKESEKNRDKPEAKAKAAEAALEKAEAELKPGDKKAEPKPIPAEADADTRARVDQALNRPVTVNADKVPRRDVLALVAGQARVRYEVDDPTLAKDKIDLGQPMTLKNGRIAARDALAEVLGTIGLSYRVTEDASLFITTAARLAAETNKKAVIEGPPIKLTLSQPLSPSDPSFRQVTRDTYARRLAAQGMRAEVVQAYLDQYAPTIFEPKGLIVLAHLSREALDEIVLLDVFPTPKKFVRTAAVIAHGVDPRLQDRARLLVKQLGDLGPRAREEAETQLFDLGPVAIPVLEDALREKDIEIVFRAERILLRLNRQVP